MALTNQTHNQPVSAQTSTSGKVCVSHASEASVQHYNLFGAIMLILGICVGSGVFFKADNILIATGGNVVLGVVMFLIIAVSIVFGGLALSVYAEKCDGAGGMYSYARDYLNRSTATYFGWHFGFLYLPLMAAIVCWVVGIYACVQFGLPATLEMQVGIGTLYFLFCAAWNIFAPTIASAFQSATTFIKMVPLLFVGFLGLFACPTTPELIATQTSQIPTAGFGWLMAAAPVAFAFDGWNTALAITPELKDAKKNLPIALVVAPLLVLAFNLLYFVGISCYLGPQTVIEAGDASLQVLFIHLLGEGGAALPNLIALIAVAGAANGIVHSILRMPQALALHGELPFAEKIAHVNTRTNFPLVSAGISVATGLIWMFIHYNVQRLNLIPNGDFSEIAVIVTSFLLPVLYLRVTKMWLNGEVGVFRGLISPIFAAFISIAVGICSLADPTRWPFVLFYLAAMVLAVVVTACRRAVEFLDQLGLHELLNGTKTADVNAIAPVVASVLHAYATQQFRAHIEDEALTSLIEDTAVLPASSTGCSPALTGYLK